MSSLTIQIDKELKARLLEEAARHQRSVEEHARTLLHLALVAPSAPKGLGTRIHDRFADIDTSDLALPARDQPATPAEFSK